MKIKYFLLIVIVLISCNCNSQNYLERESYKNEDDCRYILDEKDGKIYTFPDRQAQFDETKISFFEFIINAEEARKKNRSVLPDDSSIESHGYKLIIGLLIDAKGSVVSFSIKDRSMRDIEKKDYTPFEKYIAKRIPMSPRWTPAQCNGRDVMSYLLLHYNMPRIK